MAEELCSGQNAQEVVASLLSATYGGMLSKNRYGKINTVSGGRNFDRSDRGDRRERDRGSRRSVTVGDDQIRLYVQMGWQDGYNPRKIADYFSNLLNIQGRQVDNIDMADRFCLLSLPVEAGKKALELSASDSGIPHMHQDTKVDFAGRGDSFGTVTDSVQGEQRAVRIQDRVYILQPSEADRHLSSRSRLRHRNINATGCL